MISHPTHMPRRTLFLFCAALFAAATNLAQESHSPATALRDVLSAACSQSQIDFSHFLTARNKEAFSRMTPAARLALMKRFVLLNEPGKATSSANPAGRPILRCQTPAVTTEMQIGGTELRENIVNTVYEAWKETGFAWEQYDPETGKGQRQERG